MDTATPDFLAGGGEMGALIRAHHWSGSSLGPPAYWPQALRTVVRLMLNSGHPMYIWWGADSACLYNDAYRESIGPERHPGSLGLPAREVWAEIWNIIGPQIDHVMAGRGATWHVDELVPITRNGRHEDVYWTYSFSPIDDGAAPGGVGGILVVCTETTKNVVAQRQLAVERDRLAQLFEQSPTFMAVLRGPQHRFEIANPSYMRLIGYRPVLGRTVAESLPDAAEQGYVELLDRVFATAEVFKATGARYSFQSSPGGPVVERFVDFVYQPIRDGDGRVTGIFVQGADVTDRARAEASLRESEARFRAALRAGRMGSWETDHLTHTRQWSEEGMALFGLHLADGRGHVGGPNDEYVAAIHPDDRHLAQQLREIMDAQDSFPAEYRIVRPDGSTCWLSGRGLVVARGPQGQALRLVSIMADVTERRLAEEQLRVERERLGLALSAGRMGAYEFNIGQGALWWSPEMYALFGVRADQFVPTPESAIALIHPVDREVFAASRAQALSQHRTLVVEFRVQRPDGSLAWLAHRGQAEYDAEDVPIRTFGVVMDITARRQIEDLIRDADRKKDAFIATLAHELRNPLAPIRNAIGVLRQLESVDPTATWCHDVIDRQVTQMARLLDDLLDVARLQGGQLRLQLEAMDLRSAINLAVEIAQPVIDAAGHSFAVALPVQPLDLDGDLLRLGQVFSNILINAAKYTPPNGRIALGVEKVDDRAQVTVTDSGVGIAAHDMALIFEIFGQVDSAVHRSQGGQGIGLSLAKGLVEMHGGTIIANSEGPGKGSQFVVQLPLLRQRAQRGPDEVGPAAAAQHAEALRILVADDLRDGSDSLARLLRALGHVVEVAYDGNQAIRLAEASQPDVVLLDLGMPELDGYDVCRRIRAAPWGTRTMLIAQSGWGREQDRQRTHDAGFDHHLLKPVEPSTLMTLLRRRH